jgi:hypothetical protein
MAPPSPSDTAEPELQMAKPKTPPIKIPDMPWKKKPAVPPVTGGDAGEKK